MKLTGKYKAREVMGDIVLVPSGQEIMNFNGIKTLGGIGKEIFKMLPDVETEEEIVGKIIELYDCDEQTVRKDVKEFIESLRSENVIE